MNEKEKKEYAKIVCDNLGLLCENLELLQLERELCDKIVVKNRCLKVAVFGCLVSIGLCLFLNDSKR